MVLASIEELLRDGQIWAADTSSWSKSFDDSGGAKILPFSTGPQQKQGSVSATFGVPEIDSCLPDGGLCSGTLHEFFSKGEALAEYPPCTIPALLAGNIFMQKNSRYTIWIGKECWPSPFLLKKIAADAAGGKDFVSFCLFIDPPDQKSRLWTIESALKTQGVGTVITHCQNLRFNLSRRFTLAAEEGGTLGLFLRKAEDAKIPSAARTRWGVSAHPSSSPPSFVPSSFGAVAWELELLKCKGRQPQNTKWFVELQDETQISLHISPEMVDRSVLRGADLCCGKKRA